LPAADFTDRYGRWGIVAGASEGLGAAFARALARRGMNVVLLARRADVLEALAEELRDGHGIEVRTSAVDLADPELATIVQRTTGTLDVGVAIYNAAYAPVGDFVERSAEELTRVVDVNVRGPVLFARMFAPPMVVRRRGALVLVSSLAGFQGTPRLATYAASKAFGIVLAEGLWGELRRHGVDVIATVAGAVRTPGYVRASGRDAPGTVDAETFAEATIASLDRGPRIVVGWINALAGWIVGRLLPRRIAIAIMGKTTKGLA
jgi:short-subunit dehydrogenase